MCWMKYHNHIHIKEIQRWKKLGTQSKHGIMNLWIRKQTNYFQEFVHFVRKKDNNHELSFCAFSHQSKYN